MPNTGFTELVFIISRAGPMEIIWKDLAAGFNECVRSQKNLPGRVQLTLTLFDRDDEPLYDGTELDKVKPLRNEPYTLGGENAALDAIGRTIHYVDQRLKKKPDAVNPDGLLVIIVTEDHDRISVEFTHKEISRIIREKKFNLGWSFILASANEDAPGMAFALSIGPEDALHFEPTDTGARKLFRDLCSRISAFRSEQAAA